MNPLLFLSAMLGIGCAPSGPRELAPVTTNRPLVITIGGLGVSQLDDVGRAIAIRCNAGVIDAGRVNGYQVFEDLLQTPCSRLILVGHSLGGNAAVKAARRHAAVKVVILIDPVGECDLKPEDPFTWMIFRPSARSSHNFMPHEQSMLDAVVQAVNAASY